MSFNIVRNNHPQVAELFQLLSFLNPDGILIDFLQCGIEVLPDELRQVVSKRIDMSKALIEVENFSLLKWNRFIKTFLIHRLVQTVVQEEMSDTDLMTFRIIVINLCYESSPKEWTNENRAFCCIYIGQVMKPLLTLKFIRSEMSANVMYRVGWFLREDGKLSDSERLSLQAVEMDTEILGHDHPSTLNTMDNLALTYWDQGRLGRRILGDDHIALTYGDRGGRGKPRFGFQFQPNFLKSVFEQQNLSDVLFLLGDTVSNMSNNDTPTSPHSVIFFPDAPKTYIYPPPQAKNEPSSPPNRPTSSGSVIVHDDAPFTVIYPPKPLQAEKGLPSSSNITMAYPDQPLTIIYPSSTWSLTRASPRQSEDVTSAKAVKKRTKERKFSPPIRPTTKTKALVVLLQATNLAMSTDFAAFNRQFTARGIDADYYSIGDLDEVIEKHSSLVYGRDDIAGRQRETVLEKDHFKFYQIIKDPRVIKRRIIQWLNDKVSTAMPMDNILFVMLSHGSTSGGVLIGGEHGSRSEYLTTPEIKHAISNLPRGTYFTIINTCCYSGSWTTLAKQDKGNRFVHTASGDDKLAWNFRTNSGMVRGGVFVSALLECLKHDENGTLSEFVAEIRSEVVEHAKAKGKKSTAVAMASNNAFWKRKVRAFIPAPEDTSIQESITNFLDSVKSVKMNNLFSEIRPAKRRRVSTTVLSEIQRAGMEAELRGFASGEDNIYHACRDVMERDDPTAFQSLYETLKWREERFIEVRRIALVFLENHILRPIAYELLWEYGGEEGLTDQGRCYYKMLLTSNLIRLSQTPPKNCIGGHLETPMMWLSNLLGATSTIPAVQAKSIVETCLADLVVEHRK